MKKDTIITESGLSQRNLNVLFRNRDYLKITTEQWSYNKCSITLEDLSTFSRLTFFKLRKYGKVSLKELELVLTNAGLKFYNNQERRDRKNIKQRKSSKKIYIAGKVTGLPQDEVYAKFADMQTNLESVGFEVINPIEVVNNAQSTWLEAMKLCIKELLTCDAVYLLPCHNKSKGALIEKQLALNLGIPCATNIFDLIDQWNN